MKSYLYVLILVVLLSGTAMAQPPVTLWTRTYGGTGNDEGHSVRQTSDGGFIVAGIANRVQNPMRPPEDLYLVKTDAAGDTIWTRTYGNNHYGLGGNSVQQTSDRGYIITGYTNAGSGTGSDVFLLKTDDSGDSIWTRIYGGGSEDCGNCVQQTRDGGFIIAGSTASLGAGGNDVWLIKTDPLGNQQWNRTYGGTEYDVAASVLQTRDGGYVLFGTTSSFGVPQSYNAWLIKTDSSGDTTWTRTYHDYFGFSGNCVQLTADGGYILAADVGYFESGGGILIKTDEFGNQQWTCEGWGSARSVMQTRDGGYIVAGTTYMVLPPIFGASLGKANFQGEYQWSVLLGWGSSASEVCQTQDFGYIIAGTYQMADVWLARVAPDTTFPSLTLEIIPANPQIIIPANGGRFSYTINVSNYAPYPRTGTIWNKVRTSQNQYIQVFSPVTRTFPANSSPIHMLTQTIAGSIPYGLLYYISYLGTYPDSIVDSSYFTIIKLPNQDGGPWICESSGTGDFFDEFGATDIRAQHVTPLHLTPVGTHPNPFNPTTTIRFNLPQTAQVRLEVFDINGRCVSGSGTTPTTYGTGSHEITFDGSGLAAGVYLYRLTAGESSAMGKMVLLK